METELHLCYRILGRSVTELTEPDNRVCIRLETFHDGTVLSCCSWRHSHSAPDRSAL